MSILTIDSRRAPRENPILLDQPSRHAQRLLITNPNRIINQLPARLKIRRHAIHPDALDNTIDLMPSPRALPLRTRKHDPVLDAIIQPTALRIRQHDLQPLDSRLQIQRHARYRPARACARDEPVQSPAALRVDLRPRAVVVREVVCRVFELVGEETAARARGVGGVLGCASPCGVDELVRVDYRGGWDAFDVRAQFEEQGGLFEGLVRGHAAGGKELDLGFGREGREEDA